MHLIQYQQMSSFLVTRSRKLEGIVSKRRGSPYRSGRSPHWLKAKNPESPGARREALEDWGQRRRS